MRCCLQLLVLRLRWARANKCKHLTRSTNYIMIIIISYYCVNKGSTRQRFYLSVGYFQRTTHVECQHDTINIKKLTKRSRSQFGGFAVRGGDIDSRPQHLRIGGPQDTTLFGLALSKGTPIITYLLAYLFFFSGETVLYLAIYIVVTYVPIHWCLSCILPVKKWWKCGSFSHLPRFLEK